MEIFVFNDIRALFVHFKGTFLGFCDKMESARLARGNRIRWHFVLDAHAQTRTGQAARGWRIEFAAGQ